MKREISNQITFSLGLILPIYLVQNKNMSLNQNLSNCHIPGLSNIDLILVVNYFSVIPWSRLHMGPSKPLNIRTLTVAKFAFK